MYGHSVYCGRYIQAGSSTIHATILDPCVHQIWRSETDPSRYIVMSGHRTSDFKAIFTALLYRLPTEPAVKTITADFESAVWKAISRLMPEVEMRGCSFHLTHAVWRKMQRLGLQNAYSKKAATYNFCRRLMAIQSLPTEYVVPQFQAMEETPRLLQEPMDRKSSISHLFMECVQ